MKKIFFIKDSTENKISYYHLLFFMLALPFDRLYSTLILISFSVHTLIFFRKEQLRNTGITLLILQSVFIVTAVSLIYTDLFPYGADAATKQLAILLFPLLFALTSFNTVKYRSRLLLAFSLGCTLTVCYLFYDALHIIWYNNLSLKSLFSPAFVNHNFSQPIAMHATYLSMQLVVCIVWLLKQMFSGAEKTKRILYISCSVILLAGLIQLGSKSVLIALVIIINAGFPLFVLQKEKRLRFLRISLTIFALLTIFILSITVFRNRYVIMLEQDLHENTGADLSEKNGRFDRWNAAIDLIKLNPVMGTGAGSEIPLLKELYFERKMYFSYLNSLNVHNQYLGFLINSGAIGLLVYLGTIGWAAWQSIKNKDILLFAFIILVAIVSFSEDLLDVNKGIFFYAFFFSFFAIPKNKMPVNYIYSKRQPAARINEYSIEQNSFENI